MDQETWDAQQRLLAKRKEREEIPIREELGYLPNTSQNLHPLFPKTSGNVISLHSRRSSNESIKIHYIAGIARGRTFRIRRDIAEELIKNGMAVKA